MGLDITAYRKLTPAPDAALDEDGNPVDYDNHYSPGAAMRWAEEHFPGRAEGLDPEMTYTFADSMGFRAGSYGGYNQWRAQLANLFGGSVDSFRPGPFAELTHFPDNEGVIGPVVAAKLAKDFAEGRERAKELGGEYFFEKYVQWQAAFEMAADGGAVDFH